MTLIETTRGGLMGRIDITNSRIFVADDETANRRLLEATLALAGLKSVTSFPDGRSLLTAVERDEPDLILLDLRMPGVDGYQVLDELQALRANGTFLPVLVLTADAQRATRDRALEAGADDYLSKPFDAREVQLRVRNLLEARRLHCVLADRNAELVERIAAVSRDLSEQERAWADAAAALTQLEAGDSPEATAQAIADELRRISGLTSVFIVALDAAGNAVPLAVHGTPDMRIGVNRPIAREITDRWRERVGSSPWVGPWFSVFASPTSPPSGTDNTAMAVLPMRTSRSMLGALIAATSVPQGEAYLAQRLPMLESFAAVATALLAPGIEERQYRGILRAQLEAILDERGFVPVFQPVIEFASGRIVGYEALTRFRDGTRPDRRFADAAAVGLGFALETATLAAAIEVGAALPQDVWLSLNVSPALLLDVRRLSDTLRSVRRPIVLEISEHDAIEDYAAVRHAASAIGTGTRLAVDDAGAGYASFRHILELRPDLVKLDIGLVRGVDTDQGRQALVAGIVYFAQKSGCRLVAEGIECESERAVLEELGVDFGQGYLLGRPAVLEPVRPSRNDPGLDTARRVGTTRARPIGGKRSSSPATT